LCTFYNHDAEGNPAEEMGDFVLHDTRVKLNDFLPPGLTPTWTIKLRGSLTMDKTATYELGLTVAGRLVILVYYVHSQTSFLLGRAKLWIDDKMTIDNWTKQTPGDFFYGSAFVSCPVTTPC
jgi:beta-glucosidase